MQYIYKHSRIRLAVSQFATDNIEQRTLSYNVLISLVCLVIIMRCKPLIAKIIGVFRYCVTLLRIPC